MRKHQIAFEKVQARAASVLSGKEWR